MKAVGILWERHIGTGETLHGYVVTKGGAKIRLFSISTASVPGRRFVLRSMLPGFNAPRGRSALNEESAKTMAKQMLQCYVDLLTEGR